MRTLVLFVVLATLCGGCQAGSSVADSQAVDQSAAVSRNAAATPAIGAVAGAREDYVFGWGRWPAERARPRGGLSEGTPVTAAPARDLPLPQIATAQDDFHRDRAAILALAGNYRVDFHFMETLGLVPGYVPARPYHSWATEHVRVIEDTGEFISLQHTLAMFFNEPGGTSEPLVTKHWRQDWTYQDTDMHTFRGESTWARRRVPPDEAAGMWSQAVFQVDDSPRYEALGRWEHRGNLSCWTSERAWRPLPRREHSVRSDYDVLEGVHRIVLTPTGWVHEQHNWKRVAGEGAAGSRGEPLYIAAELGLDRYERITAPSLAQADEYWRRTAHYWAAVRRAWADVFARNDRFSLKPESGGRRLFELHFEFAGRLAAGEQIAREDAERHARSVIEAFVAR